MVAILSTFSTTGYIIATVVCVYKYIKSNSQYSVIRLIKRLCVPVMICVVLIIANSLIQEKLSTFSGMARTDDFVSGFRAWLLHPLFGDGIGSMRAMSLVRPSWRKEAEGFNSGLIQVLVQGGVYLAFPYFFVQLKSLRKSFKVRNYDKVVFELLFCFVFCITVIAFNYLTLMVLWFLALDSYSKRRFEFQMSVGIITYHAAYNYGSVLQAYATLYAVEKLGFSAKIVNYRPVEQRKFYEPMFRTNYGIRTFVKDFQMLLYCKDRKVRMERFEHFIRDQLELTEEVRFPDEAEATFMQFDTMISGSDQILNKHSCELDRVGWEYMDPYLLKGFEGRKVSYATSIANMSDEELGNIIPELKKIQHISLRELSSVGRLASLLGRELTFVADPTFLLSAQEWKNALGISEDGKEHILYYSLRSIKIQKERKKELEALAEKENSKIVVITPFSAPFSAKKCFEYHYEYGPTDFLNMIVKSKMVVTDSYHGTILPVNFGKSVYSICSNIGSEFRKTDILNYLGLGDRVIHTISEINPQAISPATDVIQERIRTLREKSMNYLRSALVEE